MMNGDAIALLRANSPARVRAALSSAFRQKCETLAADPLAGLLGPGCRRDLACSDMVIGHMDT